jgi:Glycogen recognition site of AMP-activated protein kinase
MNAKVTTDYETCEKRRAIECPPSSALNVRFEPFLPLNFQIKQAMKTHNDQNRPIPPALFQIAARLDSSDSPQVLNRGPSINRIEFPTPKSHTERESATGGGKIKITFRLEAPSAHSVKLAADFTDWEKFPLKMAKHAKGVWQTVVPLAAGHYSYRFIVDGQWQDDPHCPQREQNPFGTTNAVIDVT